MLGKCIKKVSELYYFLQISDLGVHWSLVVESFRSSARTLSL